MRLRTLKIWHRYKIIWLSLLGWAAISVVMLLVLGWAVSDYDGNLGHIKAAASWEMKAKDIQQLTITATGLRVEIAGSSDSRKIKAYLYGEGYAGEQVRLYREGEMAYVELAENPPVSNEQLTLRIIVPKREYAQLNLILPRAKVRVSHLRSDQLVLKMDAGSLQMDELDIKQAKVTVDLVQTLIKDCSINDLTLINHGGDTTVSRSQLRHWHYDGGSGDLLVQQKTVKGVWQLQAATGNITIQTSRTPYNLLCELISHRGQVAIDYQKYDWDELIETGQAPQYFQGIIGEGSQMLLVETDKGDISVSAQ